MTPTERRGRRTRLVPPFTMVLLAALVTLAACEQGPATGGRTSGSPGAIAGKGSATPTLDPNKGTSGGIGDSTPTPGPGSSGGTGATPTPAPTATPPPEATPTPPPPAVAQTVKITPDSGLALIINLPAPAGATPLANQATQVQLTADVILSNGALDGKPAMWSSSDVAIATVSSVSVSVGLVKAAIRAGAATITATSDDGKATASVVVTVKSTGKVTVGVE